MPVVGLEFFLLGAIVLAPALFSIALLASSLLINLALYTLARVMGGTGGFLQQWFTTGWIFVPLSPLWAILATSIGLNPLAIMFPVGPEYPLNPLGTAILLAIVIYIAYLLGQAVAAVHGLSIKRALLISVLVTTAWALPFFATFDAKSCSIQCRAYELAAQASGDNQWCEKIPREYSRNQCGQRMALAFNNVDYCAQDNDECVTTLAKKNARPDYCKRINTTLRSGSCLTEFLNDSTPAAFCETFPKNEELYNPEFCYRKLLQAANSTGPCIDLAGAPKDRCLWEWARITQFGRECAAVQDKATELECFDELFWSMPDAFSCYRNQDNRTRLSCYGGLAAQKPRETPDPCQSMQATYQPDEWNAKNKCYLEQAITQNDTGICIRASNQYARSECILKSAEALNDATLCDVIREVEHTRHDCYISLAAIQGDLSICIGKMAQYDTSQFDRTDDHCYFAVANATQNATLCQSIRGFAIKDGCTQVVAVAKKDPTYCERIESEYYRTQCYEFVQRARTE